MSNKPRAAIHVGAPAKSFSAAEGNEPERRGWDEKIFRMKNKDVNNHYDFTRKHLNFEINTKGKAVPLGSNPIPLHERLKQRLDELGFKPYIDKDNPLGNSDNSPNCTVGIIISGDHDLLTNLAFGKQDVDFSLQRSNANVRLRMGIYEWAMDTYRWARDRWGAENIIGFDVHLDETTPHIQIQMIPVAKTKVRGRASVKYVHKDDPKKVLSQKEWKKLSEENRSDYVRTEVERREKECVSYAKVWGATKWEVGRTYYKMHTDYHREVGWKYGLERGDDIFSLPEEEQRGRVHKEKDVLEAERQSKEAIDKAQTKLSTLEEYANALDINEEDLVVPQLKTNQLVIDVWNAIRQELDTPLPLINQKDWRIERKTAIKKILTDMQTELLKAKTDQKEEILGLGKELYKKAMKDANVIIEKNKQLQQQNERLTKENTRLKDRLSAIDETAIETLRRQKDRRINELEKDLNRVSAEARQATSEATHARIREKQLAGQLQEMLDVPEIKELWDAIQQNKRAIELQINQWIADAIDTIAAFAKSSQSLFTKEQDNTVRIGIIAQTFKDNLDATDKDQRMQATQALLGQVDWSGLSEYKVKFARLRTEQSCEEMTVPKAVVESLLLAARGRGGISTGGGGSNNELTNWDGTKKKNGWGR